MSTDEQLRKFLKKLEKKLAGNEFLLTYIDKILWEFSISDFFINEDKMDVIDKNNNTLSIVINSNSNIIITLNKNNYKDCIEVTKEQIKIARSKIIDKKTKESNLKKISYVKLYLDKNGNLEYSDFWEKTALNYDENEIQNIAKEQITIYDTGYPCSYIKQTVIDKFNVQILGLIHKNNINLNDYTHYIKEEKGCYLAIAKLIKGANNIDFKSGRQKNDDTILEKIKQLKF